MNHDLSEENYAKVLLYMEKTNQERFDNAVEALENCQFDLERAIVSQHQFRQDHFHQEEVEHVQAEEADQISAEAIQRYFLYIQEKRKGPGVICLLFYGIRYVFKTIFKGLASLLLPHAFFIKLFFPKFYGLYSRRLQLPIQKSSLKELLMKTRNLRRKSVIIAISPEQVHPAILNVLNNPAISQSIAIWYNFVGYTFADKNLSLLGQLQKQPQIIICRMNVMEEVIIINKFTLDQFANITPELLKQNYQQGLKLMQKDRNLVRGYKTLKYFLMGGLAHRNQYFEQQQEYIAPYPVRAQSGIARDSQQIAVQNQAYHALERQQMERSVLRHQEENERLKEKEKEEEEHYLRKIRKESIPQEPKQGNFIRINFRCPNGNTLVRNFQSDQKVELIYNWVEVNEEIQFQDQSKRHFQLMHSYPLKTLLQSKEKKIGEVFEDSQEKVVIREI